MTLRGENDSKNHSKWRSLVRDINFYMWLVVDLSRWAKVCPNEKFVDPDLCI